MNDNFENTKNAITSYFRGVRTEWGKITWPDKRAVVVETIYVVIITAIFTIGVLAVDTIFSALFKGLGLIH